MNMKKRQFSFFILFCFCAYSALSILFTHLLTSVNIHPKAGALVKAIIFLLFVVIAIIPFSKQFLILRHDTRKLFLIFLLFIISMLSTQVTFGALGYFVNTYIPFFSVLVLCHLIMFYTDRGNNLQNLRFTGAYKFIYISIFILAMSSLITLAQFEDLILAALETVKGKSAGGALRSEFAGIQLARFAGIMADPIVASYNLILLLTISFLSRSPLFILITSIIVILLSLKIGSKSALMMLVVSLGFYSIVGFIHKAVLRKILFYNLIGGWLLFVILLGDDKMFGSLSLHRLGLILPFIDFNGLQYFIGEGLHVGGNLNKTGFNTGQESFWGLIKFQVGLIFFVTVIYYYYSFSIKLLDTVRFDYHASAFFFAAIITPFLASSVQENSYNISHTSFRLLVIVIALWSLKRRRMQSI